MRLSHSFALFEGYEKMQRITNFKSFVGEDSIFLTLYLKCSSRIHDSEKSINEQAHWKWSFKMASVIII